MRNIVAILLILLLVGILWIGSGYEGFSEEKYVSQKHIEISQPTGEDLDLNFLKEEFKPAYEF